MQPIGERLREARMRQGRGGTGGKPQRAVAPKHRPKKRRAARRGAPPRPRSLKLKVIPTELTYVCVDDGKGNKLFEGTITASQSFRGRRLRINLGRSSASLYANGKRVRFQPSSAALGFSFSTSGRATPLPPGQRPCA